MVFDPRAAHRLLTLAALLGSGTLIAACGGSSPRADASGKSVSLARVADLSTSAAGYKMSVTEHASAAGKTMDASGTGAWDAKANEASMQMKLSVQGPTVPLEVVFAHDTIYERLPSRDASQIPGGKPWISMNLNEMARYAKLPSMSSLLNSGSSGNPSQYLEYLKAASKSVQNLGQETVAGVRTTHYRANLTLSELPRTVPAADRPAARQLAAALKSKYHESASRSMSGWTSPT